MSDLHMQTQGHLRVLEGRVLVLERRSGLDTALSGRQAAGLAQAGSVAVPPSCAGAGAPAPLLQAWRLGSCGERAVCNGRPLLSPSQLPRVQPGGLAQRPEATPPAYAPATGPNLREHPVRENPAQRPSSAGPSPLQPHGQQWVRWDSPTACFNPLFATPHRDASTPPTQLPSLPSELSADFFSGQEFAPTPAPGGRELRQEEGVAQVLARRCAEAEALLAAVCNAA